MMPLSIPDLVTTVAFLSIPLQILVALWKYPRLVTMPPKIVILLLLFALFIMLCGTGHLFRGLGHTDNLLFHVNNVLTAVVAAITVVYMLPLMPTLLAMIDDSITESVRLYHENAEINAKLLTFMAFLCHEIRNPLFAITASTQFLGDTELSEEQRLAMSVVSDSSHLMLRLVNDVLDLSKLQAGKLELERRDFDLRSLFTTLEMNMRLQLAQRHGESVQLEFTVDDTVPRFVNGDSARILQICYNLLSNAAKFTDDGVIRLHVSAEEREEGPADDSSTGDDYKVSTESDSAEGTADDCSERLLDDLEEGAAMGENLKHLYLRIVVSDTGEGIAQEKLDHIFEPFAQAKLSDYRKHGGTGLGLSIVATLLDRMGGSIEVDSEEGSGSTFNILFPMSILNDAPRDEETSTWSPNLIRRTVSIGRFLNDRQNMNGNEEALTTFPALPLSRPNDNKRFQFSPRSNVVMVVDDNDQNRRIICSMLASFDLEYQEAVDGEEALDLVSRSRNVTGDMDAPHYGMIFMDLHMPNMCGFRTVKALRSDDVDVPIVVLTANAISNERERALRIGATEFKTKPILIDEMFALCHRYLSSPLDG